MSRGLLAAARRALLGCAWLALAAVMPMQALDSHAAEPTEAEIRAEYDRAHRDWLARNPQQKEYQVRHILVAHREEAEAALARIRAGESFEAIARELSKDPGSGARGGALGWSVPSVFVEPFAQAILTLAPAGLSAAPVQTVFGWHVVEVLAAREAAFPAYMVVKERVRQALVRATGPWIAYDGTGGWAREVDVRSLSWRGELLFFRYRELMGTIKTEQNAQIIPAVVDCARRQRADVAADGSFELRSIFAGTAQERQMLLVCQRAERTLAAAGTGLSAPDAAKAAPVTDVGLSCDAPQPAYPARQPGDAPRPAVTVVVRGQLLAPSARIGEVFVEVPSGNVVADNAAVHAFRTMKCSTRDTLTEARWLRRSYMFEADMTKSP